MTLSFCMRHIYLIIVAIILPVCAMAEVPKTLDEAIEYLDSSPISTIEGVWSYDDDDAIFLVRKTPLSPKEYDIILIDSPDCRLSPGQKLGSIAATITPSVYTMTLFSKSKKGILSNPVPITATLSSDNTILRLDSPKMKFTISPSVILPRLFNILRIGIRIKPIDPAPTVADGWQKIYPPSPSSASPIYL